MQNGLRQRFWMPKHARRKLYNAACILKSTYDFNFMNFSFCADCNLRCFLSSPWMVASQAPRRHMLFLGCKR